MNRKTIQILAETLSKHIKHFTKAEVKSLIELFNGLLEVTERGIPPGLDRIMFRNLLQNTFGMADDMMMDRVFRAFDKDNDSFISVKEWVEGMSIFLRGTMDEKMKYCFDIYDLNGDGYITKEETFHMLKDSLNTQEDKVEAVKDLEEMILKRLGCDKDGRVGYADFEQSVLQENLLLEAFGNCLPDVERISAFEKQAFKEAHANT